jgi:sirohydrochlorin cobaltochelatase
VSRDLTAELAAWLAAGGSRIGQLAIRDLELRHEEDAARDDLALFTKWEDARKLANFDDDGKFRPLKTAPNLRHGWRLVLPDIASLRLALDYFYPAMLGVWVSQTRGELQPVPLRATLDRQTGMYAVTKKLTDEQGRAMVDRFCAGCLKRRLWDGQPASTAPGALPLLCHEACNLLVAEARKVLRGKSE